MAPNILPSSWALLRVLWEKGFFSFCSHHPGVGREMQLFCSPLSPSELASLPPVIPPTGQGITPCSSQGPGWALQRLWTAWGTWGSQAGGFGHCPLGYQGRGTSLPHQIHLLPEKPTSAQLQRMKPEQSKSRDTLWFLHLTQPSKLNLKVALGK